MLTTVLSAGCEKKNTPSGSADIPQAAQPHALADMKTGASDDIRATQLPANTKIRAIAAGEEVTCPSLCSHLAYCNRRVHQKETSPAALSACVGGCTRRSGESDKRRWEAMETCVRKHPGDDCSNLRACLDEAMLEIQKELHGKPSTTEKQP